MADINSFLIEWCIRYLENKDMIKKEIIKVEKNGEDDFTVHYKDRSGYFFIMTVLDESIFSRIKSDSYTGIFTLNSALNINFIDYNWKKLAEFKLLSIYFTNPFSDSEKVWAIRPYIHNKICDRVSLKAGLKSMAEMVVTTSAEDLNKKIKSV